MATTTIVRELAPMGEAAVTSDAADARLADFVAAHYHRLVRLAFLVCRDGPDAADAVQAGLERAWKRRADLRDDASMRTWLDRIVVREAIRLSGRRRTLLGRILGSGSRDEEAPDPPDPRAESALAWTDVREAYARLGPEQRAVVALHLWAGYSVAETADMVGAPLETVRSRLRLARERLRRDLGDER
jgi:RNA polymerase sigma-70 factor (ECF subfamily)